ncbi:MAG: hypothetical protein EU532_13925, partial [Promethearchaeota archaeon]
MDKNRPNSAIKEAIKQKIKEKIKQELLEEIYTELQLEEELQEELTSELIDMPTLIHNNSKIKENLEPIPMEPIETVASTSKKESGIQITVKA